VGAHGLDDRKLAEGEAQRKDYDLANRKLDPEKR